MKKKIHALAAIFPEPTKDEFDKLKTSIAEHGQRDLIVLLGDEVLEGRNRYRACIELGKTPQFRNFDPARDGSPIEFVADKNLHRRHLTPAQRAAVAKRILDEIEADEKRKEEEESTGVETDSESSNETDSESGETSGDQRPFRKNEAAAAKAAGTSARSLRDFKFVEKHSPKDAKLAADGKISMNEAIKGAKEKKEAGAKYRNEAADLLAGTHGDEFAKKIRDCEVLRTESEIKAFSRLELPEQRKILDLIEQQWNPVKALKFRNGEFTESDKVSDLLQWFRCQDAKDLDSDGWGVVVIDGITFALQKKQATEQEA